jgi:hypothetical protein
VEAVSNGPTCSPHTGIEVGVWTVEYAAGARAVDCECRYVALGAGVEDWPRNPSTSSVVDGAVDV